MLITERINAEGIVVVNAIEANQRMSFTPRLRNDIMEFLRDFCASAVEDHCEKNYGLIKRLEALSEDFKTFERGDRAKGEIGAEANQLWKIMEKTRAASYVDWVKYERGVWPAFNDFFEAAHVYMKESVDEWIKILKTKEGKALSEAVKAFI